MKKIFGIFCLAFVFYGCKEHDTPLFVTPATSSTTTSCASSDSTYMLSAVPPADPHNVLVEEFSGQNCPNCPSGKATLDDIADTGHVNVMTLYITGLTQTIPSLGDPYDFRDPIATEISANVYNSVGELPAAGIDRIPVSGAMYNTSGLWANAIYTQLAVVDSMNLSVTSSYNSTTNTATIKATATYLKNMSTQQNLSIAIVEDSITSWQEDGMHTDSTYVFTDIFRDMASAGDLGDPIMPDSTTKVAGRVYVHTYCYTLRSTSPAIKPNHCRVIAFLNAPGTGSDYHIIQSAQCPFAP